MTLRARGCPICHKVDCDCEREGGALRHTEALYGLQPFSFSVSTNTNGGTVAAGLGGYDRPVEIIESDEDIRIRFEEASKPVFICGYCEQRKRFEAYKPAIDWWLGHNCEGEGETWSIFGESR